MTTLNRNAIIICLFLLGFMHSFGAFGQKHAGYTDSLNTALNNAKTDTDKVNILMLLSKNTPCSDSTSKIRYANRALQLATDINWEKGMVLGTCRIGRTYEECAGNTALAIVYFQKALSIAQASEDTIKEANVLNFIAGAFCLTAQYADALHYYSEALELNADLHINVGTLANMGKLYNNVGDYPAALSCYDSSLKILEKSARTSKKKRSKRNFANGWVTNYCWRHILIDVTI